MGKLANYADLPPRGNCLVEACWSREILDHVFSRWGSLVLYALRDGRLRFAELRKRIDGVSEKMLAQTLRTLERDGLVLRKSYPVVPPHVEYSLTPLGRECAARVLSLVDWIEKHVRPVVMAQEHYDEKAS